MIQVSFRKIAPEKIEKLRSWMAEAQSRDNAEAQSRDNEVRETFRQETVRHEQAFLLQMGGELVLVYVMELEDPEAAPTGGPNSILRIDQQHRTVMAEVVEEKLQPELLYEVRL